MRIFVDGCARPLLLPPGSATGGKFGTGTSYVERLRERMKKPGLLGAKMVCLRRLRNDMTPTASYSEPLAGVGLTAILLGTGRLYLNDTDAECRDVLRMNFPADSVAEPPYDVFAPSLPIAETTFLDFNNFTLGRFAKERDSHRAVLAKAFRTTERYVLLNDCSVFYLRYGAAAYQTYSRYLGEEITTREEYFGAAARKFPESGWGARRVTHFSESSFWLFERGWGGNLATELIAPEDVPASTIRVERNT